MLWALILEREPLTLADLPGGFLTWMRIAGGWAAFGLLVWLIFGYPRMRAEDKARIPEWQSRLFFFACVAAALFYAAGIIGLIVHVARIRAATSAEQARQLWNFGTIGLTLAGGCALFAVLLPFARNVASLRWRRIFAIAKLSFKEAVRRRILYAFAAMLLIFLFAGWFITSKPEDQVKTYVEVVFTGMTLLLLAPAIIIASFSIPNDVRQQTIHTIITKPVERFEIVLGRFLGFFVLMSLVLLLMTGLSLLYVVRGVNPEAAEQSLKAREPVYGDLRFENTRDPNKGVSVGREWDYRSYISGPVQGESLPQYAVWDFEAVPAGLAGRKEVQCEFTFDVYRTTKGEENRGVDCEFTFVSHKYDRAKYLEEQAKLQKEQLEKRPGEERLSEDDILRTLNERFGYFQVPAKPITDYQTQSVVVPGYVFDAAVDGSPAEGKPRLQVRVKNNRSTQYIGMAKHDLYLRLDPPRGAEKWAFAWNFFKASFGLWLLLGLMIGLAVALSTYLGGVISLLVALLLYAGGRAQEFIHSVAFGAPGITGPFESMLRLARRDVGSSPLDETAGVVVIQRSDFILRWFFARLLEVIPDVNLFNLTGYVAEGFNIGADQLFIKVLLLIGYLIPWGILAYYLLRWREIAGAT
jgi:hypothetical protein